MRRVKAAPRRRFRPVTTSRRATVLRRLSPTQGGRDSADLKGGRGNRFVPQYVAKGFDRRRFDLGDPRV